MTSETEELTDEELRVLMAWQLGAVHPWIETDNGDRYQNGYRLGNTNVSDTVVRLITIGKIEDPSWATIAEIIERWDK